MATNTTAVTPIEKPFTAYNWNADGKLIAAIAVTTMDEARRYARAWNYRHRSRAMLANQIAIITNARVQAQSTRITTL